MKFEHKEEFKKALKELFQYLKDRLKLKTIPKVILSEDEENSKKLLGFTAHYEPETKIIKLYTHDRHPKDILRSFSHEVIHHWQHENGKLSEPDKTKLGAGYAQKNPWMRQMEKQAYLLGNMLFRDWEDGIKTGNKEKVDENLEIKDRTASKEEIKSTIMDMIRRGVIGSYNQKLTSGETIPNDFAEEIATKLQVALEKQVNQINWIGDKYSQPGVEEI